MGETKGSEGMTIQEAIRSGKKFRRRGMIVWVCNFDVFQLRREDLLADDWEMEEEKVGLGCKL